MDELFTQLKKGQNVRMTEQERTAMRGRLLRMSSGLPPQRQAPQKSPYASRVSPFAVFSRGLVWVLVGMIVSGTSLSFASSGALPGDSLYGVKTAIVEKARGAFAWNTEAKARYSATLVATRVSEIQTLDRNGALKDPSVAAVANNALAANMSQFETNLKTLSGQGRVARAQDIAQATVTQLAMALPAAAPMSETANPQTMSAGISAAKIPSSVPTQNTKPAITAGTASMLKTQQTSLGVNISTDETKGAEQLIIPTAASAVVAPVKAATLAETISNAISTLNAITTETNPDATIKALPQTFQDQNKTDIKDDGVVAQAGVSVSDQSNTGTAAAKIPVTNIQTRNTPSPVKTSLSDLTDLKN